MPRGTLTSQVSKPPSARDALTAHRYLKSQRGPR